MATYQVEEMVDDQVVARSAVTATSAIAAVEGATGRPIAPRTSEGHWFRVVDETASAVF